MTTTSIKPDGVMFEIIHNGNGYYGFLSVDFVKYKVYGNTDIPLVSFTLFDSSMERISPIENPSLYEELDPIIKKIVIDEDDE